MGRIGIPTTGSRSRSSSSVGRGTKGNRHGGGGYPKGSWVDGRKEGRKEGSDILEVGRLLVVAVVVRDETYVLACLLV